MQKATTVDGCVIAFRHDIKSLLRARVREAIENLNRELRRRTKTQGSFSTENAGVTLVWALVAFGQIEMRRIVGYQDLSLLVDKHHQAAA